MGAGPRLQSLLALSPECSAPAEMTPSPGWLLLWPLCRTPTFPQIWPWGISYRSHQPDGRQLLVVTALLHLSWPGSRRSARTRLASLPSLPAPSCCAHPCVPGDVGTQPTAFLSSPFPTHLCPRQPFLRPLLWPQRQGSHPEIKAEPSRQPLPPAPVLLSWTPICESPPLSHIIPSMLTN